MENYLAGRKNLDSAETTESQRSKSGSKAGLPIRDVERIPITDQNNDHKVECVTQNGKITKIVVTCKCGEQIELDCKYGPQIS